MTIAEHSAATEFYRIPLGRRISELMQERGDAFSIRAFSARLAISRETLRLMLVGERHIAPSELEMIANGLGMSVERIKQMDTVKQEQELAVLLKASSRTKVMMLRANSIAKELVELAKGATECGFSWMNLGRTQFQLQQYDEAHDSWVRALEYAEKINEGYNDSNLLYKVTSFLMISFTVRKEYTNILHTLNVVEGAFSNDPEKMGYVHYTKMKWNEHKNNIDEALRHAYIALDLFKQTEDRNQIGKAYINVAHFEYHCGNLKNASESLSYAMDFLQNNDYFYLIAVKDYCKILLELNEKDEASRVIRENLDLSNEYPEINGALQIMYSFAEDNPAYADSVCNNINMSVSIRSLACKSLMEIYSLKDDADSVMRYYNKERMLTNKKFKFLD